MPKVKVESKSKYTATETYQKIKSLLENDKDLRRMDADYKCDFNDSGLSGCAKGGKFSANLQVTAKGEQSTVCIEVDLPLMLTPVKGVVQSTLQKKVDAALT